MFTVQCVMKASEKNETKTSLQINKFNETWIIDSGVSHHQEYNSLRTFPMLLIGHLSSLRQRWPLIGYLLSHRSLLASLLTFVPFLYSFPYPLFKCPPY